MKSFIVSSLIAISIVDFSTATTTAMKDAFDLEFNKLKAMLPPVADPLGLNLTPVVNQTFCTCGVFLSGQIVKGSKQPPIGNAVLLHEQDNFVQCTPIGHKQCTNKCLESVSAWWNEKFSSEKILIC